MQQLDRLLDWPQLSKIVPYSRVHVGRLEREENFPRRVQVGPQRVAWRQSEIQAWLESRPRVPLDDGLAEAAAKEFVVRRLQRPDEEEEGGDAAAKKAAPAAAE